MTFLPEGETIPEGNTGYMKFELGENKFRVAGSAITGFELWVNGKPLRRKTADQFTSDELRNADVNKIDGKKHTPKYFWAFPVYNYKTEKVQILEVKQVTVMRGIESYLNDEDYGKDPQAYDLVVTQGEGANGKIEYLVKAKPPKALDEGLAVSVRDAVENMDLTALYRGEDPFAQPALAEKIAKDTDEINF